MTDIDADLESKIDEIVRITGIAPEVYVILIEGQIDINGKFGLVLNSIGRANEAIAIQNDDFPILIDLSKLVAALLAGAAYNAWAPIAVAALLHLLYRMHKKRIKLTALQAAILRELIDYGPLSAEEIEMALNLQNVDLEKVVADLQTLSSMRKADGTETKLVTQSGDDRWVAVDI